MAITFRHVEIIFSVPLVYKVIKDASRLAAQLHSWSFHIIALSHTVVNVAIGVSENIFPPNSRVFGEDTLLIATITRILFVKCYRHGCQNFS